ncbi:MAG: FkbM family methyltransferase, partial [Comamonas sp.]|nr:FkbM family methyltransferase [Comamonas sp.]
MSDMQKNGVQLEDFVIATDDAEGFGLRGGAPFEPEVLHALRQYIQPGSVVLDIGANVGYFTAHISKLVGSAGRVHAFEPEPRNFSLLSSNVAANHLQNVVL